MEETCFSVGMGGHCGFDCPVYQKGGCENHGDILPAIDESDLETLEEHFKLYPQDRLAL